MKSAEDIVKTLKLIKFHLEKDNPGDAMEALNAFADERVKEVVEARAEALEEVAKLAGDSHGYVIAAKIRALKDAK